MVRRNSRWRSVSVLCLALVIAGCETPGPPPRTILITLSSGINEIPFSPEELEDPAIRASIEQCKRMGAENCGMIIEPIDSRNEFKMGEDSSVYTVIRLGGVAPNRTYEVEWQLFDPYDGLLARLTIAQQTISPWRNDYTLDYTFRWSPQVSTMWYPGRWRVEIFVNGFKEGQRYFYVRDSE